MLANNDDAEATDRVRAKRTLSDTSLAYEVSGDVWRAKAYKRAAQIIDAIKFSSGSEKTNYLVDARRPESTPGFGPSSAAIVNYVNKHPEFCDRRLSKSNRDSLCVPPPHDAVVDRDKLSAYKLFRGVLGVGHAAALRAVNEHGARSLDDLLTSYQKEGKVPELISHGVRFYHDLNTKIPRNVAETAILHLRLAIARASASFLTADDVIPLGSYRRGKHKVGDIDLLVTRPGTDMSALAKALIIELKHEGNDDGSLVAMISKGRRKLSFLYRSVAANKNKQKTSPGRVMRVDVFSVHDEQEIPFFMMHGTGSAAHNEFLRQIARKKGHTLNEYGLFDAKTRRRVDFARSPPSEREVYSALGVPFVPPERRN